MLDLLTILGSMIDLTLKFLKLFYVSLILSSCQFNFCTIKPKNSQIFHLVLKTQLHFNNNIIISTNNDFTIFKIK